MVRGIKMLSLIVCESESLATTSLQYYPNYLVNARVRSEI